MFLCPVVAPKSPLSSRSPDGALPGPARPGSGSHTHFDDVFQVQGGADRMREVSAGGHGRLLLLFLYVRSTRQNRDPVAG